jgi:hypothetical protein
MASPAFNSFADSTADPDQFGLAQLLVNLLRQVGHDVQIPVDVGLSGEKDPIHLIHAALQARALVSANHDDFRDLHNLVIQTGGKHPGILIIRRDNDPRRDMSVRSTVRAIDNLLAANVPIESHFIILNHWCGVSLYLTRFVSVWLSGGWVVQGSRGSA